MTWVERSDLGLSAQCGEGDLGRPSETSDKQVVELGNAFGQCVVQRDGISLSHLQVLSRGFLRSLLVGLRSGSSQLLPLALSLSDKALALPLFPRGLLQALVPLVLQLGKETPTTSDAAPIDRRSPKPTLV